MKNLFSLLLIFCLLVSASAMAESLDYAGMTDEQLHEIINLARNELAKRELVLSGETLILDAENVQVYTTGVVTYDGYRVKLEVIVVNGSSMETRIDTEKASVNGWTISNAPGLRATGAGKKQKGYFDFYITPDLLPDVSALEDIEFVLELSDAENGYKNFYTSSPITIHIEQ